jgi:drug/metabolite transporter (DMT)-like permease
VGERSLLALLGCPALLRCGSSLRARVVGCVAAWGRAWSAGWSVRAWGSPLFGGLPLLFFPYSCPFGVRPWLGVPSLAYVGCSCSALAWLLTSRVVSHFSSRSVSFPLSFIIITFLSVLRGFLGFLFTFIYRVTQ